MTHNGIDIDQFILLTIYPSIAFFGLGLTAKKTKIKESSKYALQGLTCIIFSILYFIAIPNGGAQGLATVLAMFSGILFLMARRHLIHPKTEEEQQQQLKDEKRNHSTTAHSSNDT